jgi:membrane protease YdiL (CAAX protease family)
MRAAADRALPLLGSWIFRRANLRANVADARNALILFGLVMAESIFVPYPGPGSAAAFYLHAGLRYALRLACLLVLLFVLEKRSMASVGLRNFRLEGVIHRKEVVWTAVLCLAMLPLSAFTPLPSGMSGRSATGLLVWSGYVLLCIALVEELVWRGYIFSRLSRATGILPATIISALLNALWHLPYYQRAFAAAVPSLMIYAFVHSVVLCLLTALTGRLIGRFNIYPAILSHWMADGGVAALGKTLAF